MGNNKIDDELQYNRLTKDLTWAYPQVIPDTPDWNYCGMVYDEPRNPSKPPLDWFNKTVVSKYPSDYPEGGNVYCRILDGDVIFFSDDEYNFIDQKVPVMDFPKLNSRDFYNKKDKNITIKPIIPSGTYVDIQHTETHVRREKISGKLYYYIMCRVKVNENDKYNLKQIVNEKDIEAGITKIPINRGDTGWIWHMFMGADESSPVNIGYMDQSGTEYKSGYNINQSMRYYYDYEISLPDNQNPKIIIAFKLEGDGRKKFSLGMAMKANDRLFTSLYKAGSAQDVNVKKINISSLIRIAGSEAHKEGRACDIASIITNDGKMYLYTVGYDKGSMAQPQCPEVIEKFENAFMAQAATQRVWGPWSFYDKTNGNTKIIPNMIHLYEEAMKDWPSETATNGEKLLKETFIPVFINNEVKNNGYKAGWKDANGNDVLVKPNDDGWVDIIYYHYTHRHHGHYTI